jgi:eukaryotic-like serine/threonine-protein kinase
VSLRLDHLQLVGALHRSRRSTVWRAVDLNTDEACAVKVLEGRLEHALEVRAMSALDHPAILALDWVGAVSEADAGTHLPSGAPYLVTELAQGSLADLPPRTWFGLRTVLLHLLGALGHAHGRQIVHRDLKPHNVLVFDRRTWDVRVADFGIAAVSEADPTLSSAGRRVGTPAYMPPEQVLGEWRDVGPWSDMYSLACLAWRLATGVKLFPGSSTAMRQSHLYASPPPLEPTMSVPRGLEAWLARCLMKEPWRRFQTAAEALHALEALGEATDEGRVPSRPSEATSTSQTMATWSWDAADATPISAPTVPTPRTRAPMPAGWERPPSQFRSHNRFLSRSRRLVGRDRARTALWEELLAVSKGQIGVVAIRDQGGTGAPMLARWFCEHARETGAATVLCANHSPLGGSQTGITAAVRRCVRTEGLGAVGVVQRLKDWYGGPPDQIRSLAAVLSTETIRAKWQIDGFMPLVSWMRRATSHTPMVIHISGVAWAAESLHFIRRLLRSRDLAVLVVIEVGGSALEGRQVESHALAALEPRDVVLPAPTDAEMSAILQSLVDIDDAATSAIVARADGDLLFATELLAWRQDHGPDSPLPSTLHDLLHARVVAAADGDAEAQHSLEQAAFLPEPITGSAWWAANQHRELPTPARALQALFRAGLVEPAGGLDGQIWRPCHQALFQTLQRMAREGGRIQACHRAAGATTDTSTLDGEIRAARHRMAAGETRQVLSSFADFPPRLYRFGRYADARQLTDELKQALVPLGPSCRLWGRWAYSHGQLQSQFGDHAGANEVFYWGLRQSRRYGWPLQRISLLLQVTGTERQLGHVARAKSALSRAKRALGDVGGAHPLGWTSSAVFDAMLAMDQGDLETALEAARAATALAEPGTLFAVRGLAMVADAERRLGRLDDARTHIEAAIATCEAADAVWPAATYFTILGEVCRESGDLDRARLIYSRAADLFQAIGSASADVPLANLGLLELERGDFAAAERLLRQAREGFRKKSRRAFVAALGVALLPCVAHRGAWDAFDQLMSESRAILAETDFVDADNARCAQLAAQIAKRAKQGVRAAHAARLAADQWRALGESSRVAECLGMSETS